MDHASYSITLCGDLNLVRNDKDKSNGIVNPCYAFLFNDWINRWDLLEISVSNRCYTWSNNQDNPTFVVIDKVLTSMSWDSYFLL